MKTIDANLRVIAGSILLSLILTTYWGTALGEFHHVDDEEFGGCLVCHDMKGEEPCANVALTWCQLSTPNSGTKAVVFLDNDPPAPWDYADGDSTYDGICEVCHTNTGHHRNDGSDNTEHFDGDDCIVCHHHDQQFAPPFAQSHNTHTAGTAKGPDPIDCDYCHSVGYYWGSINEMVTEELCDPCHSPGGAFDGVGEVPDPLFDPEDPNWEAWENGHPDSIAYGAAYNWVRSPWDDGVYEDDGVTLKSGKEKWCAGCHDADLAYSQPCFPDDETVEVEMDNEDATYAGDWPVIEGNACAYEEDFQWNAAGSGVDTATWTPDLPEAGDYKVYARWVDNANRATDAPYTIHYSGGSDTIDVDQTTAGCMWNYLGTYPFAAGTAGSVVLSDDANGYLIADAVKLTRVNTDNMVMDNSEAIYSGSWGLITGNACAYTGDFQWNEAGSGSDTATWTPYISEAGDYRLYARWVNHPNRATDAPYTITYSGGSETIDMDQTTAGCQWNYLGTYPFAAGTAGSIVLSDDANGVLVADAIRLQIASSCPDGTYAPNVVGDNTDYGFFVTGHKISCVSCHDTGRDHIDHYLRTYASGSDNYQAGYRLRRVGAMEPMNVPRPKTGGDPHDYLDHFALCFDCHNSNELLGESDQWDASKTNFDYNSGANGHYLHLSMNKDTFDSDFDSIGDSDFTCTTCHNVHGSPTPAMTRNGQLILATRNDLPPDFGALGFGYITSDSYPNVDPDATVVESIGSKMVLAGAGVLQNGVCAASCHGVGATVFRAPYYGPRVLSHPKIDRVLNDGVDMTLLTAYVLDHNPVTVPTVTIDIGPLDASPATQTMYDDGTNGGDETAGDHVYSFETTVPDTVDPGPTSLDVTATDGDGTGTNQANVLVVDPEEVVLDNANAEFVGTWPVVAGSGCAYLGDFQYNEAGSGADTATWKPDLVSAGLYEVYARWVSNANRASDAPYTISYDGGSETIVVDQTTAGCQWNYLGTYPFAEGTLGSIVLTDNANGIVIADGLRLTLADPSNLILDNADATYTGTWPLIKGNACAYQENFQYNDTGTGTDTATWTPYVPETGDYNVYAWWVDHPNRATDAPYTINYNGGFETVYVDQTTGGCTWHLLGTYSFAEGTSGSIVLSDDANGYLIADGVKLEAVVP
jgi:hypothetical protein